MPSMPRALTIIKICKSLAIRHLTAFRYIGLSGRHFPEELKIEVVKQVTERGYKSGEVA